MAQLPKPPQRPPAISPANIAQLHQKITYSPHSGTIFNVSFSPSGDRLVLACDDHVELFETVSGNSLGEINVGWGAARAACFHPNGEMLAICGGNSSRLTIWDVASRMLVQEVQTSLPGNADWFQPNSVAFSATGNTLIAAGFDNRVVRWDWNGGHPTPRQVFDGEGTYSNALHCSRDGLWLAGAYGDGRFQIWRMSFDDAPVIQPGSVRFSGEATAVSFNNSASRIAVSTYDGFARLLELSTGREITQFGAAAPTGGQAFSVALAPNRPLLALAQSINAPTLNSLQFYDVETLAQVRWVDLLCDYLMFSPNGRQLLVVINWPGRDDQATLWTL